MIRPTFILSHGRGRGNGLPGSQAINTSSEVSLQGENLFGSKKFFDRMRRL